jgi:uncharacterized protein YdcH (DUF465 family)
MSAYHNARLLEPNGQNDSVSLRKSRLMLKDGLLSELLACPFSVTDLMLRV